uniref:Specifically androgen-regulated gene protein n=1 Tax=Salarias fasciatus TaxID=181472 RepID=A0A672H658_SALFA
SAEEKACIMFLEETIDSLDTEEDSGLSNDEPDHLPTSAALANKLADLSASLRTFIVFKKLVHSYVVPTPYAVGAPSSMPGAKPFPSLPVASRHGTSPVPSAGHVAVPSSANPQEYSGRAGDGYLPRGPLSYEALVHLRKSATAKKTPLCPTVDHTIESNNPTPTPMASNLRNIPRPAISHKEVPKSKTSTVPAKAQNKDPSNSVNHANDPIVVRHEALQKLGLLRNEEPENDAVAPLPQPKSHSSMHPMPNRFTITPSNSSTSRSPSFYNSQVATEPKNRPLQSSASFHHDSRRDELLVSSRKPTQSTGLRKSGVERSATMDNHRSSPEQNHRMSAKPAKTSYSSPPRAPKPSKSKPAPQNPANVVGYTAMVVPGVGSERKEALRKLGLLKK